MLEERIYRRSKLDLLDITAAIIEASNIEIIDVSLKGISLNAARRLDIGGQYSIKIQSKGASLNLKGIVVWAKISGIRKGFSGDIFPIYSAGLEFIDMSEYLGGELNHFIENHKGDPHREDNIREAGPGKDLRRYPRFEADTPAEAFIIEESEFHQVQDLSFGGFCMGSERPLKITSTLPMIMNFSEENFIVFKGRIISCRLNTIASPRTYFLGIAFNEMSAKDRGVLTKYIRLLNNINEGSSA